MDDNMRSTTVQAAEVIADHAGTKTVALDVSRVAGFTDFLIITTVQSYAQLQGLMGTIDDFLAQHGIETLNPTKRPKDDQWAYVDCGNLVIHIMRPEARSFYELEKVWHEAEVLYSQLENA